MDKLDYVFELSPLFKQPKRIGWCRGRDSNPHGLAANGFSYHYVFRRPRFRSVRGLDYTFTFYYALLRDSQAGAV